MLKMWVIFCFDVVDGCVVKGVNFVDFCDVGDLVQVVCVYDVVGVDEICFLDIYVMYENCGIMFDLVICIVEVCFVLLIVGGGVCSYYDVWVLLLVGVDKVSFNFVVVVNFDVIVEVVDRFGSQCIVCVIDVKIVVFGCWEIFIYGGCKFIGIDVVEFVMIVVVKGVGEILLISMDCDGMKFGFNILLICVVVDVVNIFVIVLGGVGVLEYLVEGVIEGYVSVVLVVLIFYFGIFIVCEVKEYMVVVGILMRLI